MFFEFLLHQIGIILNRFGSLTYVLENFALCLQSKSSETKFVRFKRVFKCLRQVLSCRFWKLKNSTSNKTSYLLIKISSFLNLIFSVWFPSITCMGAHFRVWKINRFHNCHKKNLQKSDIKFFILAFKAFC